VGDTSEARTRGAFDSEESFWYSVGLGQADLYTFNTLEQAASFAKGKIEALMTIELSINTKAEDTAGPLKITSIAVPSSGLWFEELFVVAFEELIVVSCRGASAGGHVRG
jgi:hypothetical protein